jgi:DNA-binding CsgD family transcriptional regulator
VAAVARTNREPMHRTELTPEIAFRILKDLERAPLVTEAMIDRVSASDLSLSEGLSRREIQVLELLSHGTTLAQAADSLGIGFETARSHKKAARFKLRAKNTTHAVATALRKGLIR